MRRMVCLLGVCALLAGAASAAEIAYWHFNDQTNLGGSSNLWRLNPFGTPEAKTEYGRDYGDGAAELSAWGPIDDPSEGNLVGTNGTSGSSSANNWGSFSGNSLNARHGVTAGGTIAMTGTDNNLHYFLIELDDALEDVVLSYAYRASSTGFATHIFHYSTDNGTTWYPITTINAYHDGAWYSQTVNVGNVFNATSGHESNLIRFTVDGATGSTGSLRIDNLAIDGRIVPEPASLLLLGLAGLLVRRR